MNRDKLETLLTRELHRIAPDIDMADVDRDGDLREEFDIDSMDFLNLVAALSELTGAPMPDPSADLSAAAAEARAMAAEARAAAAEARAVAAEQAAAEVAAAAHDQAQHQASDAEALAESDAQHDGFGAASMPPPTLHATLDLDAR